MTVPILLVLLPLLGDASVLASAVAVGSSISSRSAVRCVCASFPWHARRPVAGFRCCSLSGASLPSLKRGYCFYPSAVPRISGGRFPPSASILPPGPAAESASLFVQQLLHNVVQRDSSSADLSTGRSASIGSLQHRRRKLLPAADVRCSPAVAKTTGLFPCGSVLASLPRTPLQRGLTALLLLRSPASSWPLPHRQPSAAPAAVTASRGGRKGRTAHVREAAGLSVSFAFPRLSSSAPKDGNFHMLSGPAASASRPAGLDDDEAAGPMGHVCLHKCPKAGLGEKSGSPVSTRKRKCTGVWLEERPQVRWFSGSQCLIRPAATVPRSPPYSRLDPRRCPVVHRRMGFCTAFTLLHEKSLPVSIRDQSTRVARRPINSTKSRKLSSSNYKICNRTSRYSGAGSFLFGGSRGGESHRSFLYLGHALPETGPRSNSSSTRGSGCIVKGRGGGTLFTNSIHGNTGTALDTGLCSTASIAHDTAGCGGHYTTSFDYICLSSPEAARVFSACWKRAGCPDITPGKLVCVGDGTRAAAEDALIQELQLYEREQQGLSHPQNLSQQFEVHRQQHLQDEQQRQHLQSEKDMQPQKQQPRFDVKVDLVTEEEQQKQEQQQQQPLRRGMLPDHVTTLNGTHTASCPPTPLLSSSAAKTPLFANECSIAGEASADLRASAQAPPSLRVSGRWPLPAADAAAAITAAGAAQADREGHPVIAADNTESVKDAAKAAAVATREHVCQEAAERVRRRLQRLFLSFKPSSSCAARLAEELPPRPPLFQRLCAALYTLAAPQAGHRSHSRTRKAENKDDEAFRRLVERMRTTLIRPREHARPRCAYTTAEAVICAVGFLRQTEDQEITKVLLRPCCPCWLQTRVLWPASALARATLQNQLQNRPREQLRQYAFGPAASKLRMRLYVLPTQQADPDQDTIAKVAATCQGVAAAETTKHAPLAPSAAVVDHCLQKGLQSPAAADNGSGEVADSPALERPAAPHTAEETENAAANRLFHVERYDTYTLTQLMLTPAERNVVLQYMQETLHCSKHSSGDDGSSGARKQVNNYGHATIGIKSSLGSAGREIAGRGFDGVATSVADLTQQQDTHTKGSLCNHVRSTDSNVRAPAGNNGVSTAEGVLSSASGSSANCSGPHTAHPTDSVGASGNSSGGAEHRDGKGSTVSDAMQTAGAQQNKERVGVEGLIIVVFASPSAIWAWTANGLPVSAAECCTGRQLPSYTAVHAGAKHHRQLFHRSLPDLQHQRTCSIDSTNGGRGDLLHTSGRRAADRNNGQTTGNEERKSSKEASDNSATDRTDDGISSASIGSQISTLDGGRPAAEERIRTREGGGPRKRARTARESRNMAQNGGDPPFCEAEDFAQVLQTCQQALREARELRKQQMHQMKLRRLLALCIGPTTTSAAKQAGFAHTATTESGSLAALAGVVEKYATDAAATYRPTSADIVSGKSSPSQTDEVCLMDSNSHSCTRGSRAGEDSVFRPPLQLCSAANAQTAGNSECRNSGRNDSRRWSSSGKYKENSSNSLPGGGKKRKAHIKEEQLEPLAKRKTRVLVILTRADGRNDALLQELLQRKTFSLRHAALKTLAAKELEQHAHQQRTSLRDYLHVPWKNNHWTAQPEETDEPPVEVLEVPLLQLQACGGVFEKEQQRLMDALGRSRQIY